MKFFFKNLILIPSGPFSLIIVAFVLTLSGGCSPQPHSGRQVASSSAVSEVLPEASVVTKTAAIPPIHTVGQVTRHAPNFIRQRVRVQGYLLKKENGYLIISDEIGGVVGTYDLPVTGNGISIVEQKKKYEFQGLFISTGFMAINKNPNHLELEIIPKLIP